MGKKLASYGDRRLRRIEEIGRLDARLMVHIDRLLREQFERGQQSLKGICVREAGGLVLRLELPAWKSWAA